MQKSFPLTSRLVLLALLAAVPGALIQLWNEFDLRRARTDAVRDQVLRVARNQESEINRIAEGARQFLVALAQVPQIKNAEPAACNALLTNIRENYQAYRALIVADAAGAVACSSIGPGPSIADRRYFRMAIERQGFATGEFVQGRGTGAPGFHFAYPLRDDAGQIRGVIAAALDLDWFARRLGERLPPNTNLYVADANATVLVRLPDNEAQRGRSLPEPLRTAFASGAPGVVEAVDAGKPAVVAFLPAASSEAGLFISVARERDSAFADLRRASTRSAVLIIAGLSLSLLIAWLWGAYGIQAPIQRLLAVVQRLRAGQYGGSGVRWGGSELGRLGQAFDELAHAVADREQRLRDSEAALRARESYLSAVLDRVPVGIMQTDPKQRYVFVNRRFCEIIGRSQAELIGRSFIEFTHPDDVADNVKMFRRAMATGQPYTLRKRYLRPNGPFVWIEVTVAPLGPPSHDVLAVAVDLTDRVNAEEQQALLINELNHRVKNTLAAVQSLAFMSKRYSGSEAEFYDSFLDRLAALSATHDLLTEGYWKSASLRDLVDAELRPYAKGDPPRVEASGEAVELNPHQTINLGMMLHELATNAAKYGALSGAAGFVHLTWRLEGGRLEIDWRESGGPPAPATMESGFGSRLIQQTARSLGGEIRVRREAGGLRWTISIPMRPEPAKSDKVLAGAGAPVADDPIV